MIQEVKSTNPEESLRALGQTFDHSLRLSERQKELTGKSRPRLVVEVGPTILRGLFVKPQGDEWLLEHYEEHVVPAEIRENDRKRRKFFGRRLRRLRRRSRTREFVCLLPPGPVRNSIVSLPALQREDLTSALSLKALKLVQGTPETWVWGAERLQSRDSDNVAPDGKYLLSAVAASEIEELAHVFAEAGSLPSAITTSAAVFQELYVPDSEDPSDDDSGAWVVVQMRAERTSFHIYRRGVLEYSRDIDWGGNDITAALMDVVATPEGFIELSAEEAEDIKRQVGIPADEGDEPACENSRLNASQIRMMLHPKLNTLVFELRNSIRFYQQSSGVRRVERLTLTGGAASLPGIDDYIHEQLKIRPHRFGLDDTQLALGSLSQETVTKLFASGSALVASLQSPGFGTNLVPAPMRWEKALRRPFRVAMALLFAGILVSIGLGHQAGEGLAQAEEKRRAFDSQGGQTLSRETLEQLEASLAQQLEGLQHVAGHGVPFRGLIADLARRTPPGVQFARLMVQDTNRLPSMTIQGFVALAPRSTKQPSVILIEAFRDSPFVQDLEIESLSRQGEENEQRFLFSISIVPYLTERGLAK